MLTLTRRTGESLYIEVEGLAEPIQIRLDQIRGWNQARISIGADKERVKVHRRKEWCCASRIDRD